MYVRGLLWWRRWKKYLGFRFSYIRPSQGSIIVIIIISSIMMIIITTWFAWTALEHIWLGFVSRWARRMYKNASCWNIVVVSLEQHPLKKKKER